MRLAFGEHVEAGQAIWRLRIAVFAFMLIGHLAAGVRRGRVGVAVIAAIRPSAGTEGHDRSGVAGCVPGNESPRVIALEGRGIKSLGVKGKCPVCRLRNGRLPQWRFAGIAMTGGGLVEGIVTLVTLK